MEKVIKQVGTYLKFKFNQNHIYTEGEQRICLSSWAEKVVWEELWNE